MTEMDLPSVLVWAPTARVGDLLVSAACDRQQTEELMNEVRRLTR